jgi:hypothetical protein
MTATAVQTSYFADVAASSSSRGLGLGLAAGADVFSDAFKPRTPGNQHAAPADVSDASPTKRGAHRLLYRGALSLPDSHIVLDGLTFVASPAEHSRGGSGGGMLELLENPLALALESMRGRPTIRLIGEQRLDALHDKWIDESGDVTL